MLIISTAFFRKNILANTYYHFKHNLRIDSMGALDLLLLRHQSTFTVQCKCTLHGTHRMSSEVWTHRVLERTGVLPSASLERGWGRAEICNYCDGTVPRRSCSATSFRQFQLLILKRPSLLKLRKAGRVQYAKLEFLNPISRRLRTMRTSNQGSYK